MKIRMLLATALLLQSGAPAAADVGAPAAPLPATGVGIPFTASDSLVFTVPSAPTGYDVAVFLLDMDGKIVGLVPLRQVPNDILDKPNIGEIHRTLPAAVVPQATAEPKPGFKERHRVVYLLSAPVRWAFNGFCRLGRWSERTGLTGGLNMVGAAGAIATPFVCGFRTVR